MGSANSSQTEETDVKDVSSTAVTRKAKANADGSIGSISKVFRKKHQYVYWRIPSFSKLPFYSCKSFESPEFVILDTKWRLQLSRSKEDIIHIALKNESDFSIEVWAMIVLMDKHSRTRESVDVKQLFQSSCYREAKDAKTKRSAVWGEDLVPHSYAVDDTTSILKEDTLKLKCRIVEKDLDWYKANTLGLLPSSLPCDDIPVFVEDKQNWPNRVKPELKDFQRRFGFVGVALLDALPFSTDLVKAIADYASEPRFFRAFGSHGRGHTQFTSFSSIRSMPNGGVVVCETKKIQLFTSNGEFGKVLPQSGPRGWVLADFVPDTEMTAIAHVVSEKRKRAAFYAPDEEGSVKMEPLIVKSVEFKLVGTRPINGGQLLVGGKIDIGVFNFQGTHQFSIGNFARLGGACLNAAGDVYATDEKENKVCIFDVEGKSKGTFGGPGAGEGQFDTPQGICCDSFGRVYVCDRGNHRVQVFGADGQFLSSFGSHGIGSGTRPNLRDRRRPKAGVHFHSVKQ